MRLASRISALLCLATLPLSADVILTMKTGERYELPKPATHRNGMVSFTTKEGRFLTVKQSEVAREETVVPPPPTHKVDRTDTKQLGAVAREQREERGIDAPVAEHPAPASAATTEPSPEKKAEPAPAGKAPAHPKKKKKKAQPPPPPPAPEASEPH